MFAAQLFRPVCPQHENSRALQPSRDVVEELAGRIVAALKVLEHEQQPALARRHLEQVQDRLEEPQLCVRRIAGVSAYLPEAREQKTELIDRGAQPGPQEIKVASCDVVAKGFEKRQIRQRERRFRTCPAEDRHSHAGRAIRQLDAEPRFAHTCVSREEDHPSLAAGGREQRIFQLGELGLPADKDWAQGTNGDHDAGNASPRCGP